VSARDEVLARVRAALGEAPTAPPVVRAYRTEGAYAAGSAELVEQLVDRLVDYRATVVRVPTADDDAVGAAVAEALDALGCRGVVVPPGAPSAWTAEVDGEVVVDDGSLDATALDGIPAVLTGSVVAVSETGTIVLDGSDRCGRRAITLVPDVHVCVVAVADVVGTVPEGLARLDPQRPLTFVSGPSATSDIELQRVEGVHGPRTLVVVLAG
jgi:L-lactate dehydrogenase complex protein LldG